MEERSEVLGIRGGVRAVRDGLWCFLAAWSVCTWLLSWSVGGIWYIVSITSLILIINAESMHAPKTFERSVTPEMCLFAEGK